MEIDPRSLPDLFQQPRDLDNSQEAEKIKFQNFRKKLKKIDPHAALLALCGPYYPFKGRRIATDQSWYVLVCVLRLYVTLSQPPRCGGEAPGINFHQAASESKQAREAEAPGT